ncbi:MAG: hypothetical protein P4L40_02790 [Terracidiphilus sp.]|nr:hypothetical protein [Terracidiphilus sp.]
MMDALRAAFFSSPIQAPVLAIASTFPDAIPSLMEIAVILQKGGPAAAPSVAAIPATAPAPVLAASGFLTLPQRQFIVPRGRFDVEFSEAFAVVRGKTATFQVCKT